MKQFSRAAKPFCSSGANVPKPRPYLPRYLGRRREDERFDQPNFSRKIAELAMLDLVEDDTPAAAAAREHAASTGRKPRIYRLADRKLRTFERTAFDAEPTRRIK